MVVEEPPTEIKPPFCRSMQSVVKTVGKDMAQGVSVQKWLSVKDYGGVPGLAGVAGSGGKQHFGS
jgi:hypothetical protein